MIEPLKGRQIIIRSSRELTDEEANKLEKLIDVELAALGVEKYYVMGRVKDGTPLSSRQKEIILLVRDGFSDLDIAKRLFVSHQTIKNTMLQIKYKLGAYNRTHAVIQAIRYGEIELGNG